MASRDARIKFFIRYRNFRQPPSNSYFWFDMKMGSAPAILSGQIDRGQYIGHFMACTRILQFLPSLEKKQSIADIRSVETFGEEIGIMDHFTPHNCE